MTRALKCYEQKKCLRKPAIVPRLVQHECDHLDGIIFLKKVKGTNGFATKENIDKYNLRNEK